MKYTNDGSQVFVSGSARFDCYSGTDAEQAVMALNELETQLAALIHERAEAVKRAEAAEKDREVKGRMT